jgi:lysophospholipase L1-like esterase
MKFYLKTAISLFVYLFLVSSSAFNQTQTAESLKWHDLRNFTIEGKAWNETANFYDRLPAKAEKIVRPEVWRLAQNSAGISARFITDADSVSVRWKLRSNNLALSNMTATAVSGVDLYVKEKDRWLWAASGRPTSAPVNKQKIIANISPRKREFMLYLPLYNGIESIEIGLPERATVSAAPAFSKNVKPIVFYGTSIVQGASATRAGMAYPSILSRNLNRPAINLGFSGNGRMEAELAELLTEIDAAVYVIDCLPNLSTRAEVEERAPKVIEILRRARPAVPIILIENIIYPDVFIEERKNKIVAEKNAALRGVYRKLVSSGVKNLHYVRADNLIGNDGEATVDGIHPTDLGFARMADALAPTIRKVLR